VGVVPNFWLNGRAGSAETASIVIVARRSPRRQAALYRMPRSFLINRFS